jgi:hypothetical protein
MYCVTRSEASVSYILEIHYIKFTKCFCAKCGWLDSFEGFLYLHLATSRIYVFTYLNTKFVYILIQGSFDISQTWVRCYKSLVMVLSCLWLRILPFIRLFIFYILIMMYMCVFIHLSWYMWMCAAASYLSVTRLEMNFVRMSRILYITWLKILMCWKFDSLHSY